MNIIHKLVVPCRVVFSAHNFLLRHPYKSILPGYCNQKLILSENTRTMSQRSITSFFKVSPPKGTTNGSINTAKVTEIETDGHTDKKTFTDKTTVANGKEKRSSKRQRLSSSDSEPDTKTVDVSPTASGKVKKVKRQRIESSGSEVDSQEADVKAKTKAQQTGPLDSEDEAMELKENIKIEKTSPKTYASPKSKRTKKPALVSKTLNSEDVSVKKELSTKSGDDPVEGSGKKEDIIKKEDKSNTSTTKNGGKEGEEVTVMVPDEKYDPAKPKYHPIEDACWSKGQPVPYLALARTFEAIEAITARLKIVEILANLLRSVTVLTPEDLLPCTYLCLNQLGPPHLGLELGIAETYLMKAVGQCTGRSLAQVRAAAQRGGDLGRAAELARGCQRTLRPPPPLAARAVCAALGDIARMTGHASVNKKINKIQSLYVACRHSEARYLIRSLEGKLRIGLAEQSVLQALALAVTLTPPAAGDLQLDAGRGRPPDELKAAVEAAALAIKAAHSSCPDYERLLGALLAGGLPALGEACRMQPGLPVKPMLAHPTRGVGEVFQRFEGSQFTCEWKYDGERAQLHVPGEDCAQLERAAIFSRNQEDNTSKYPDVLRRLPALLRGSVSSCVLDCEAVAYDTLNKQILPFQVLSTRKRKGASEADIKVQVCVFVFDLLFLNGEPLAHQPLRARRQLLREHFNEVPGEWQFATYKDCTNMEEVQQFLEDAVKSSCEGLMVKTLEGDNAKYDIARRSHNWLKLKKDYLEGVGDTLDLVVIGGYRGRGKRRGAYGGFLLACYEPGAEAYQSLCKIGTGFSDEQLQTLSEQLDRHAIPAPRSYYMVDGAHSPDAWFGAAAVWEVRCADLSLSPVHRAALGLVAGDRGVSLRFPRFVRVREDKAPEQATTAQQVAQMYLAQDQVKNQLTKPSQIDDFY